MGYNPSSTGPQMKIVDFLLARIAEDESHIEGPWSRGEDGLHIITEQMHARIAAEVKAKRRIVAEYADRNEDADLMLGPPNLRQREWSGLRVAVCALAEIYADHPDFLEEWRYCS